VRIGAETKQAALERTSDEETAKDAVVRHSIAMKATFLVLGAFGTKGTKMELLGSVCRGPVASLQACI
jgi:hypothetical protein